jgi:DNA recombination protein RmuC
MNESELIPLLFLAIGLTIGALLSWLFHHFVHSKKYILRSELEKNYLPRGTEEVLRQSLEDAHDKLEEKESKLINLSSELAGSRQQLHHLSDQLTKQEENFRNLQEQNKVSFENLANRLLDEKSQKFTLMNLEKIGDVLAPLKEQIRTFAHHVDLQFNEETRERISLKKEIEQLRQLNQQLSSDANSLARALKGDSKIQGDWGELQLELLLEKVGLIKGTHFMTQQSFSDESGKQKRPDFLINLPGQKHLVIDSKVSLKAYDLYCQAENDDDKKALIRSHLDSIRGHIKDLSSKNYQQLYQINQPDYVLLFVPVEPALNIAVQEDNNLFVEALERNIVIVSGSTLLATMRTVAYIWTQEKQQKNVLEIARQSGALYDKFVSFVEDLQGIGTRIDQLHKAYEEAMYKLHDGKRKSDTLIGRAERIRDLGARSSKELPPEFKADN